MSDNLVLTVYIFAVLEVVRQVVSGLVYVYKKRTEESESDCMKFLGLKSYIKLKVAQKYLEEGKSVVMSDITDKEIEDYAMENR